MPNFLGSNFKVDLSRKASATLLKKHSSFMESTSIKCFFWFEILSPVSLQPPASVIFQSQYLPV